MKTNRHLLRLLAACLTSASILHAAPPAKPIPDALKPWETWATWNDEHRLCPTPYSSAQKHLCFWPSRLGVQAEKTGGKFDFVVTVYHETWVPLPGGSDHWPVEVRANGAPLAVLEHDGQPSVRLGAGTLRLEGAWRWSEVPQRLAVPPSIGLLALVIDGAPVEAPVWDAQGFVWLKRDGSTEETDKNFLAVKLYSALQDGIPLWLSTEVELTVSGKSREEELGTILPAGWKLSAVESPIPVAIDDAGRLKAQVRAGKWTIRADAFRFDNPKEFRYAEGAKVPVEEQLVAFRAQPDFRTVEITGSPSIDVSQTTFPAKWRELPVYRWETTTPFRLEERLRGMGDQKPPGLSIAREWWLDEDGRALTFRDRLGGVGQHIWRLDAAEGQDLGSVRSAGEGQLITRSPQTSAPGVEIRTRNLQLEATGRMPRAEALPATGWRSDAESLQVTLNLPPGWRLLALFGADWVRGDWLTAWTLLDLFLLLIFSLAIFRLWGVKAGLLAFVAFGLAYHEPGAPRYLWLILLIPLALQRVVPEGRAQRIVGVGKWIVLACFILAFVPFLTRQVQQALYPQLEVVPGSQRYWTGIADPRYVPPPAIPEVLPNEPVSAPAAPPVQQQLLERLEQQDSTTAYASRSRKSFSKDGNLSFDTKARIQTGPGVPEWKWREVSFGWNGPVTATQQVRPVLIPLGVERALSTLRVILLLALAALLLRAKKSGGAAPRPGAVTAAVLLFFTGALASASAQSSTSPDQATLDRLRERLLETSDAFPHAADLPLATLTLTDRKLTLDVEVHAAIRTAVPLPGKLPAWSPVAVFIDDKPDVALRRDDGFLWVVVEPGVHRVRVEGSLANVTEWEWSYLLKPRQVKIDAPEWTFTGVKPGGVPEAQVFFARKQRAVGGQASYDRQELQSIASIERHLELGLIWQVRTTVSRLSPAGKAVALRVPLLPGENVLSSNAVVKDGFIEVRLGAQEQAASWESGLPITSTLNLATRADDSWVERWRFVASPVWNVTLTGLAPTFEPGGGELVPVWQPWPGEQVALAISRPEALAGATVTVNRGTHEITLGKRQRTAKLDLALRCSLGEDFLVALPADAEVTALTHDGRAIPVRQDAGKLIIPVRPGEQNISIAWKTNVALGFRAQAGEVQLPVESANIKTIIHVPEDRWVLWANGPRLGPAVRFWGVLVCALLAAFALGRLPRSPLSIAAWMLLAIGLTQVPLPAALVVVSWLFLLAWRGGESFQRLGNWRYNLLQVFLIGLTVGALGVLVFAVSEGLLGSPVMFITGNGSTSETLRWFQPRSGPALPQPGCLSISIWWYRLAMLLWALWLAAALLRWLRLGWENFSSGGFFRRSPKKEKVATPPPPLPNQK